MLFQSIAQELPLSPFTRSFSFVPNLPSKPNPNFSLFFMRASPCSAFALFRAISSSHLRPHRRLFIPSSTLSPHSLIKFRRFSWLPASSVEQLVNESTPSTSEQESWDFSTLREIDVFDFDKCAAATDLKHLLNPDLEVKDLSELPEQWRRARLAWLCKELPAHKAGTLVRLLNGQKKWMRQDDATYVVVHCMRIRENETGFRFFPSMELQRLNLKPIHCPQSPVRFPSIKLFLRHSSAVAQVPTSQGTFNAEVQPYLRCSMPHKHLRVAVLLSGGVDSSVALHLLHAAGHSCTAFYLKIWFQEDFENFWSECPWEEDLKYARAVCNQVDVPLEVVHLTDEYWKNVVSYIIEEYRCGHTPNPDVLCNTRIKFGAFMDAISDMGFDYVSSGHYANVVHPHADQMDEPSVLELSQDMTKDQTYFLSHLSQSQLKRLIFPLGCISKDDVRRLAAKFDLPNKDRKDSQGICFLGKIKFSEFVARHIGEREGIILEAETGDFLGRHQGFWFHTIGQRQGLRLPGGPWYVVEKDVKNNVIFVSRNYFSLDKRRRLFRVGSLKWVSGLPPRRMSQLQCKVRHGPGFYNCSLQWEGDGDGGKDTAVVHLSEDDQGLAAGQFAAFYEGSTCIGSGVILESWDDRGFPVCTKALEIARMEDKSKLGNPVKIKVQSDSPQQVAHNSTSSAQLHETGGHSEVAATKQTSRN